MDNLNNHPNNQGASTDTEKLLHSGQLSGSMFDKPAVKPKESDLSLEDAWAERDEDTLEFKMKVPDSAAEIIPAKSRKRLFLGLGAAAAGLFVAGGAFFGISAANDTPKSEPVAEAPADPSEVPVGEEPIGEQPVAPGEAEVPAGEAPSGFEVFGLPTVAELEVSADQTDEEIAQDLISVISQWGMTGANREMMEYQTEGDNGYLGLSEYITKVGEQVNPVFEQALYGENATNPDFQEAIALQEKQHAEILAANYQTYGTQNEAPYYQKQTFNKLDGAFPNDDGSTTLLIGVVLEDNGDQNIVAGSSDGYEMEATLVINNIDGKIKIVQPPTYVAN